MGPNNSLSGPSSSSSWWWGSPTEKYRIKRIDIYLGQVVTSCCLSWGRQVWFCLLQDCGSVASFCIMRSVLLEGFRDESGGTSGAFDWLQHLLCCPFTCMSCGCGLPRVGADFTAEPVRVTEDGCSLSLARGCSTHPRPSSPPLWSGGPVEQAWQQVSLYLWAPSQSCWAWSSCGSVLPALSITLQICIK